LDWEEKRSGLRDREDCGRRNTGKKNKRKQESKPEGGEKENVRREKLTHREFETDRPDRARGLKKRGTKR